MPLKGGEPGGGREGGSIGGGSSWGVATWSTGVGGVEEDGEHGRATPNPQVPG